MENSSIIFLVVSASFSFGIGRTILYFRNKKKRLQKEQMDRRQALALQDAPPEPESKNKSKRKRQIQMISKAVKKHWSAFFLFSFVLIGCQYIVKCHWTPLHAVWLKLLCRLPWSEFHFSFQSLSFCRMGGALFSLKVLKAIQVNMRLVGMP